jgi:hypothetical protein
MRCPCTPDQGAPRGQELGHPNRTESGRRVIATTLTDEQDQADDADGRNEEKPNWHRERPPARGDLPRDV